MEQAKKLRAAIYMRASTGKQDIGNQRPSIDQLIHQRGFETVAVYSEHVSAVKQRPQYDRMMRDAARGEFDVLVVWAIDRFGRSMHGNLADVMELDRLGVRLVSVREHFLDTSGPTRSLLLAIVSWIGSCEREQIAARTRAGLDRARARGVRLGRKPISIDTTKLIELHERGLSVRHVAKALGIGSSTAHRLIQAHVALKAASGGCPADASNARLAEVA
jgi:DNA invertase Pin-like site-specific DNA recombinase